MADENKVINFAMLSWKKLRPEDDYEVKKTIAPEIIKRHEDTVRCYLENDFNSDRVIRIMTGFKQTFGDLEESGQNFHKQLVEILRELSRKFNKRC